MKKILAAVVLMACVGMAKGAAVGDSFTETGLAYSNQFDFPSGSDLANRIGAIVTYTSGTFNVNTFTDGRTSSGTATIISTAGLAGNYITIGSYKFCAGITNNSCPKTDTTYYFPVGANVNATATNLATAIYNSSPTTGVSASPSSAQVDIVGKNCDGINLAITTSSSAKISKGGNMASGVAATVAVTDIITKTSHGYSTGLKVALTGSSLPTGLSATDYYIIKLTANTFKLASSLANAIAGTPVDITAVAVGATAHTYTLTPAAISGTPSFKWQASNDASNWVDLSVSSVTMSAYVAGGTSSYWDFSWYPFKWLRLNVIGPTTGGIYLKSSLSVKK